MRSFTRASLAAWAAVVAAAAGCGSPAEAPPASAETAAPVERLWEEVRRESEELGRRWDVRWLESLKGRALELQGLLPQWQGTEEARRELQRQLDGLLAKIRAAEAVERAKRSFEDLQSRSDPAVRAARDELERAWSRFQEFAGQEVRRPFP
ncbi:MAG: hypothetical protein N2109_08590 [Fimbriimonadales bacterium]|nr:hypothetical protein [Fimbriimonadales bacterium]